MLIRNLIPFKMNSTSYPSIAEFFANKTVLITGGTGFVGKCLVEKLLRDCPKIKKIYLILRPKKCESCQERFKSYIASEIFQRVRDTSRIWYEKLAFIPGDITVSFCGLKINHMALVESVQVLIHSAASISFHSPLSEAIKDNLEGTFNVLNLATNCRQLQAFIYVSTALVMPGNSLVEEKVYATNIDPRKAMEIFSILPEQWVEKLTPTVVGNRCTYQYSKHLAENLVESFQHQLPVCIVRPGGILASLKEPCPGWNDQSSGLSLYFKHVSSGEIHTVLINPEAYVPITPVDTAVNTILGAAWRRAATDDTEFRVYNCVTETNKVLLRNIFTWGAEHFRTNPRIGQIWYPRLSFSSYFCIFALNQFLFRYVPAKFHDFSSKQQNSQSCRAIQIKHASLRAILYGRLIMSSSNSRYTVCNMQALDRLMLPNDRLLFPTCLNDINWQEFSNKFSAGLLDPSSICDDLKNTTAVNNMNRLKRIYWATKIVLFTTCGVLVILLILAMKCLLIKR